MCEIVMVSHVGYFVFYVSTYGKFSNLHLSGCKNCYIKSVVVSHTADITLYFTK